jgi:hypothetical protein
MTINDTFTRAWIAGALGGLVGQLIGFLPHYMGISQIYLSDWLAILIFGRTPPFSLADSVYAVIVGAGLAGVTGIIFAFLIPVIKEENIYFKGWIIFVIPWWILYLVTALARTEGTLNLSVMSTVFDGISTSVIGLVSVYCYQLLKPN